MDREKLLESIDQDSGDGYYRNVETKGNVFYRGNSYICFKIRQIDGLNVLLISYAHIGDLETSPDDYNVLFAYLCNYAKGRNVKFVYYSEKQRDNKLAHKYFKKLGLKIHKDSVKPKWRFPFQCNIHGPCTKDNPCSCSLVEAFN